jgi:hypothetical protein
VDIYANNDQPLRSVSKNSHVEIIMMVLEKGVSADAKNDHALRGVVVESHLEVVNLLRSHIASQSTYKNSEQSNRCTVTTFKGTQCKKTAIAGTSYCNIHSKK